MSHDLHKHDKDMEAQEEYLISKVKQIKLAEQKPGCRPACLKICFCSAILLISPRWYLLVPAGVLVLPNKLHGLKNIIHTFFLISGLLNIIYRYIKCYSSILSVMNSDKCIQSCNYHNKSECRICLCTLKVYPYYFIPDKRV